MSKKALIKFLKEQVADAKAKNVLFSLHMKATMMKVSDPIMFGYAVKVFFASVFEKHEAVLKSLHVDVNNGFGNLLSKIQELPEVKREEIEADIELALTKMAQLWPWSILKKELPIYMSLVM